MWSSYEPKVDEAAGRNLYAALRRPFSNPESGKSPAKVSVWEGDVIHLVTARLFDYSELLGILTTKSWDFH
jgi:hypothetical protein